MDMNLDISKWFEFTTLDLVAISMAIIFLIWTIIINIHEKKKKGDSK